MPPPLTRIVLSLGLSSIASILALLLWSLHASIAPAAGWSCLHAQAACGMLRPVRKTSLALLYCSSFGHTDRAARAAHFASASRSRSMMFMMMRQRGRSALPAKAKSAATWQTWASRHDLHFPKDTPRPHAQTRPSFSPASLVITDLTGPPPPSLRSF